MKEVTILEEPRLVFAHDQRLQDPHDGLSLFGPYESGRAGHPRSIHHAVVGTRRGIDAFGAFAARLVGPVPSPQKGDPRLWPPFPGFEAAFHANWSPSPTWSHEIEETALDNALRRAERKERSFAVVNLFMRAVETARKRDTPCDVIVCVVPDDLWLYCRPKSIVPNPIDSPLTRSERKSRAAGQLSLLEDFDPRPYRFSPDFRRQIKARSMAYDVPIQIVRESTLWLNESVTPASRRSLTPLSDRAWNLATALYYKAGGRPWKLDGSREGVCYIGIAFRRTDEDAHSRTACCAAQMFLDSGDGIVFLGEYGPWYSPDNKECHLSRKSACNLLEGVLRTYADLEGKELREVFLHSRSDFSDEEFSGYRDACPPGVKVIGVRVRREFSGLKLFRPGTRPVLRGTFWRASARCGYLWASGFKPRLRTYDGPETPVPLRIDIRHGDADIDLVARDILGLTKLNYNACTLGDALPVTIKFSNAVGEILVSNPGTEQAQHRFRFYI